MKRLMSKFDLLNSYWNSVIKTTIENENLIRFQLKIPCKGFDVHEFGDFSFIFENDNVKVKYSQRISDLYSDNYSVDGMSKLLDNFVEKIKNEEHLCDEMFFWHLSNIFGLDNEVYKGRFKKLNNLSSENDSEQLSDEEIAKRIQEKFKNKLKAN